MRVNHMYKFIGTFLLMAAFGAVLACGSSDEAAAPAAPAAATGSTAAPAAPAAPAAAAVAATPVPGKRGKQGIVQEAASTAITKSGTTSSGLLTLGMKSIGVPLFRAQEGAYPRNRTHWTLGIAETITYYEPGTENPTGMLAEKWEFADDMSEMVFTVRQDIPWHGDGKWGNVTAADFVYTINDMGADNINTKHDNGTEASQTWHPWYVKDEFTAVGPIKTIRHTWGEWDINRENSSASPIFSKKVYDTVGPEEAIVTMIATGPYEVQKWIAGEEFLGEAVPNHWRIQPAFQTLRALEVPEETTLLAMVRNGQVDIAEMSVKNIGLLSSEGFDVNSSLGMAWTQVIMYAGNYWQRTHSETGEQVPVQPGFNPESPWVGDPYANEPDPGTATQDKFDFNNDSMQNALKVRQALNMAIDRDAINEVIFAGLAQRADSVGVPNNSEAFQDKWITEFDPEGAKALLAEAGYENGFTMPYFFPPDFGLVSPEAAEAVANMWENIGIDVEIERTSYTTRRPTMIKREIDLPWYWMTGIDKVDYDGEQAWLATAHVGWQPGMQVAELWDYREKLHEAVDSGDRANVNKVVEERGDFLQKIMIMSPLADMPKLAVANPKTIKGSTEEWQMYTEHSGQLNNMETIQPAD
jgi:ABC-type transport system substrate-binding protein